MTIQDWAAFAQIVSAVAVVITLIYLAVQVRHSKESLDANTKAIRGQTISDVTRSVQDHMNMIVQGQDVASAFLRFGANERLEKKDALLADAFLTAILIARQNEFLQWRQGLLDDSVFTSLQHGIFLVLGSENGHHWWTYEGRNMLAPEFVAFVEDLLATDASGDFDSWQRSLERTQD